MRDALGAVRPWLTFAGSVLVVAVLYWAQAVIVPVALAMLLAFVLSPAVAPLQRRLGGVVAVLLVVTATFTALGIAAWAATLQLRSLAQELPGYQHNIQQKIRDVRWIGQAASVESLQQVAGRIQAEFEEGRESQARPIVVEPQPVGRFGLPAIGSFSEPLVTAVLVTALVIFMLLERQDLRNRLLRLFGHGRLAVTTRAFDEAGRRISRYLLTQSLINLVFGVSIGVGLYAIGVPFALLWAALAAALRFVPYVGAWIAAGAPILVSLGAFNGWTQPLLVMALFAGLELLVNLAVESFFYAAAAGVSQVGVLIAMAFWTWLWGPLGLLLATPLTVCVVVMGKYVPGLEFIATLMADAPILESDVRYYQRLLAGDQAEAADLIEQHVSQRSVETVYDAVMLPALTYAERDRIEGRLSIEEEAAVIQSTRELLEEGDGVLANASSLERGAAKTAAANAEIIPILGWPVHGEADGVALRMLSAVLEQSRFAVHALAAGAPVSEGLRVVKEHPPRAICLADLPPGGFSKSRYIVKRVRAVAPEAVIVIGRWAPAALADEDVARLSEAGADGVGSSLLETREQLCRLLRVPAQRERAEREGRRQDRPRRRGLRGWWWRGQRGERSARSSGARHGHA